MSITVHTAATKDALARESGAALGAAIAAAIEARGTAHLVLTGGSMGSAILAALGRDRAAADLDWSAVHLWWGDERYLSAGDAERNHTQNAAALLDRLDPAPIVHSIAGPDSSRSAEDSAQAYAAELAQHGPERFDVTLLGMGPDGHVASLFPHHPAQRTTGVDTVAVHQSPKPPADRVSLTFEALNRSRALWFLVAGADKSQSVAAAMARGTDRWDIPAAGVHGLESTTWWLDATAAHDLPEGLRGDR